ncbi:MAG: nicotinate-nucleotide adenylyltransferase [Deltaproteobacteria bacterium]|nr:nicotinate-nucleotide adenylyltransferase [Deltaproteobacteria bacterium]MBW2047549.1 nicotinate-nucleotide adenylyltransferase [Deltaproteobacteria bacterium]MBW2111207.1 nicotinate-nucleotide adenylyltransferase [Deltaproteobacteria bacterium]MBW2353571.1 nicotinate-nucleotide adenylyltransferase [Deltaproteobacteria bacterium]HDZ90599.1 nicotinate-nucleotide adenylyltransferase [Deltaproteobacteria bacterium]
MRTGILGGTFDPIHLGHLRSAEEISQDLHLDRVYLIPSASPPHKAEEPVTPFRHRLAMARLASEGSPLIEVLDIEGRRSGHSYSIETLREFHRMFPPDPEIYFILGMDAFLEISTWKDYRRLFDYAHFVIINRAGFQVQDLRSVLAELDAEIRIGDQPHIFVAPSGKTLRLMKTTTMDISSTGIRGMVKKDRSIRFLVPDGVRTYIEKEGLYRNHGDHR